MRKCKRERGRSVDAHEMNLQREIVGHLISGDEGDASQCFSRTGIVKFLQGPGS